MSQELAVPAVTPLALIDKAIEKGISPDQLGKLMDLQERWEQREAAKRFAEAVTAFQAECPRVKKERQATIPGREGKTGYGYKFANFEDVDRAVAPLLAKHQIVVTFDSEHVAQGQASGLKITCRVRVGTHVEDTRFTLPIPAMNQVNDAQRYGVALSYAKRYAFCAALKIVVADEDDDAADLFERITAEQVAQVKAEIERTGTKLPAFLNWIGVAQLDLIPAAQWAVVQDHFRRKPSKGAEK